MRFKACVILAGVSCGWILYLACARMVEDGGPLLQVGSAALYALYSGYFLKLSWVLADRLPPKPEFAVARAAYAGRLADLLQALLALGGISFFFALSWASNHHLHQ